MPRNRLLALLISSREGVTPVTIALFALNCAFSVLASSSFKVSAMSPTWRGVLTWQVIGNTAGFLGVLTLTAILRHMDLHVAYPISMGLSILGTQTLAAKLIFHESITASQWGGTLLILLGIWLLQA